jgi:hypothetical protein
MMLMGFENAWAGAALGAMFPGSCDVGLDGIGAMDVAGFMHAMMRRLPLRSALGLRVAVWIAALAPLFELGRVTTIARLKPSDRERLVVRLVKSRLYIVRSLMMMLKTFGALLYAGDASVRARLTAAPPARRSLVPLRLRSAGRS